MVQLDSEELRSLIKNVSDTIDASEDYENTTDYISDDEIIDYFRYLEYTKKNLISYIQTHPSDQVPDSVYESLKACDTQLGKMTKQYYTLRQSLIDRGEDRIRKIPKMYDIKDEEGGPQRNQTYLLSKDAFAVDGDQIYPLLPARADVKIENAPTFTNSPLLERWNDLIVRLQRRNYLEVPDQIQKNLKELYIKGKWSAAVLRNLHKQYTTLRCQPFDLNGNRFEQIPVPFVIAATRSDDCYHLEDIVQRIQNGQPDNNGNAFTTAFIEIVSRRATLVARTMELMQEFLQS